MDKNVISTFTFKLLLNKILYTNIFENVKLSMYKWELVPSR